MAKAGIGDMIRQEMIELRNEIAAAAKEEQELGAGIDDIQQKVKKPLKWNIELVPTLRDRTLKKFDKSFTNIFDGDKPLKVMDTIIKKMGSVDKVAQHIGSNVQQRLGAIKINMTEEDTSNLITNMQTREMYKLIESNMPQTLTPNEASSYATQFSLYYKKLDNRIRTLTQGTLGYKPFDSKAFLEQHVEGGAQKGQLATFRLQKQLLTQMVDECKQLEKEYSSLSKNSDIAPKDLEKAQSQITGYKQSIQSLYQTMQTMYKDSSNKNIFRDGQLYLNKDLTSYINGIGEIKSQTVSSSKKSKEAQQLSEAAIKKQLEARARLSASDKNLNYSSDRELKAAAAEEMLKAEVARINKEYTANGGQPLASYKINTKMEDGLEKIQSATLTYIKKDLGEIVTDTYKWVKASDEADNALQQDAQAFEGLVYSSSQYSKNMEQIAKYEQAMSKVQGKLNSYQEKLNSTDRKFIGETVTTTDKQTGKTITNTYSAANPIKDEQDLLILAQKKAAIEETINGYKARGTQLTAEEEQRLKAQVDNYQQLAGLMKTKEYSGGVLTANELKANKAKETERIDNTIAELNKYEGSQVTDLVGLLEILKSEIKEVDSGSSLKNKMSEFIQLKGEIDNTIDSAKELQTVNTKLETAYKQKYTFNSKGSLNELERGQLLNIEDQITRLEQRKKELAKLGVSDSVGNTRVGNVRTALESQPLEKLTTQLQGYFDQINKTQSALDKINANGAKAQLEELSTQLLQLFLAFREGEISIEQFGTKINTFGANLKTNLDSVSAFGKEEQNVAKQAESLSGKLENALSLKNTNNKTNEYTQQIQALQGALSQIQANHKNGVLNDEELKAEQQELKTIQELLDAIRSSSGYVATNGKGTIDSSTIGKVYGTEDIQAYLRNYGDSRNWKFKGFADDGMSASFKTLDGSLRSVKVSMDQVYDSTGKTSNVLRVLDKEAKSAGTGVLGVGKGIKQIAGYFTMYFTGYHMVTKALSEFRQGLSVFKEYDTALTQIKYTMNLTETEFQNLGHSAMEMAEDMSSSISNAMKVMEIYANMSTTTADMQAQAKSTLMLANVTGEDSGTAADQIQSVMQQFNMDSSQTEHIVDAYEKISQSLQLNFTTGIEGMAAAVKNVGAVANDAGMSFEELAAVVGKVQERTREDGSSIGNSLKTNKIVSMYRNMHNVYMSKTSKA